MAKKATSGKKAKTAKSAVGKSKRGKSAQGRKSAKATASSGTVKSSASTSPVRSSKVLSRRLSSLPSRSKGMRVRSTPDHIARSLPRSQASSRWFAYYAMGAVALGLFVSLIGYQGYMTSWGKNGSPDSMTLPPSPSIAENLDLTQPHQESPTPSRDNNSATSSTLTAEFQRVSSMSLAERIDFWSAFLESDPKGRAKVKTLAEGHDIADFAPIVPNKFDCTTYVETVVALSRSQSEEDFFKNLMTIRYKNGQPDFTNRNHFAEADWIPNNERANILADITSTVAQSGRAEAKVEHKTIHRDKWLAGQVHRNIVSRSVASVAEKEWPKFVEAKVAYIDIADIRKVMNEIPSGTILNLVHKDDGKYPTLITHQGFVIRRGSRVFLRHASIDRRSGRSVIRENELYSYLRGLLKRQHPNSNWPLIGVNLNQIKDSTSASNLRSEAM